jgi:hypothetical protein
LKQLEDGVALGDLPAALAFLQGQPDSERVRALTVSLARQWAGSDAHAAARWAEHVATGDVRRAAIDGVAIVWADKDLEQAVQWARSLPAGDEMDGVIESVAYEAARTAPLVAMDLAGDLPETPERDALVLHAALQWAAASPVEAASWAIGITNAALRERVLANVATAWGESDPVHAAQLAVLQIPPGKAQNDAVIAIVQRWAQQDPKAAMGWARSFPKGELFELAAENINRLAPGQPADQDARGRPMAR